MNENNQSVPQQEPFAEQPPVPQFAEQPPMPQFAGQPPMPQFAGQPPMPQFAGQPPMPQFAEQPPMPQFAEQPFGMPPAQPYGAPVPPPFGMSAQQPYGAPVPPPFGMPAQPPFAPQQPVLAPAPAEPKRSLKERIPQMTVKQWLVLCMTVLVVITGFLGMFFHVIDVQIKEYNGFQMMVKAKEVRPDAWGWHMFWNILYLVAFLGALGYMAYRFFTGKVLTKIEYLALTLVPVVFTFVSMLSGIIATSDLSDALGGSSILGIEFDICTYTYVPFLLTTLLAVASLLLYIKLPEQFTFADIKFGINQPAAPLSPEAAAEQLAKLKELCDNGVISQADFEAKKQQILGI